MGFSLTVTPMFSDSKSAVDMAFDPVAFKNTKHILRDANYVRDYVAKRIMVLLHVPGNKMIADLLTKAVARPIFHELLKLLDGVLSHSIPPPPHKLPTRAEPPPELE